MAYAPHRGHNAELDAGMVDGKYIRFRPNTSTSSDNAEGNVLMRRTRASLNPLDNYQIVEYPNPVRPDGE